MAAKHWPIGLVSGATTALQTSFSAISFELFVRVYHVSQAEWARAQLLFGVLNGANDLVGGFAIDGCCGGAPRQVQILGVVGVLWACVFVVPWWPAMSLAPVGWQFTAFSLFVVDTGYTLTVLLSGTLLTSLTSETAERVRMSFAQEIARLVTAFLVRFAVSEEWDRALAQPVPSGAGGEQHAEEARSIVRRFLPTMAAIAFGSAIAFAVATLRLSASARASDYDAVRTDDPDAVSGSGAAESGGPGGAGGVPKLQKPDALSPTNSRRRGAAAPESPPAAAAGADPEPIDTPDAKLSPRARRLHMYRLLQALISCGSGAGGAARAWQSRLWRFAKLLVRFESYWAFVGMNVLLEAQVTAHTAFALVYARALLPEGFGNVVVAAIPLCSSLLYSFVLLREVEASGVYSVYNRLIGFKLVAPVAAYALASTPLGSAAIGAFMILDAVLSAAVGRLFGIAMSELVDEGTKRARRDADHAAASYWGVHAIFAKIVSIAPLIAAGYLGFGEEGSVETVKAFILAVPFLGSFLQLLAWRNWKLSGTEYPPTPLTPFFRLLDRHLQERNADGEAAATLKVADAGGDRGDRGGGSGEGEGNGEAGGPREMPRLQLLEV